MKNKQGSHAVTLALLALALGGAVYLNWSFARNTPQTVSASAVQTSAQADAETQDSIAVLDPLTAEVAETTAETTVDTEPAVAGDKNYGEAQLVSINKDSGAAFFESARLSRSKSRDEALDTIKASLKNAKLGEEEKAALTKQLQAQVNNITAESGLETMIKAKGFADCVVALDNDKATVTVMTANDALTAAEVTVIRDILLERCSGMQPQNITVVEVK